MSETVSQFSGVEIFFLICAVIGGFFVAFKFIMMFIGLDHGFDSDMNVDFHGDMDMGGHDFDGHHADSDIGFKALSLHGITSFLMMFGLVGLALFRQNQAGVMLSLVGAVAAGCASIWVIGKLFLFVNKLKSSGTISIDSTVGAQGNVYLKIPESGTGRVLINVRNSLREYDAKSHDNKTIDTGSAIRVIWVDGNVLVVEAV